jgi:N-acetylglucosamine-6-sulfatase
MTLARPGGPAASVAPTSDQRPNVIVIETDDQTVTSLRVMDSVESLIADRGATFQNSFVNLSLCCPSRSTFLTGQYAHNHGVLSNNPPSGGYPRFEHLHGRDNLAVWLRRAGYHTGLIGKYLNGYSLAAPHKPPGWSDFHAAIAGDVYDYDLAENGRLVHYGTEAADYKEDVLSTKAVDFVDRRAHRSRPFFLWLTYGAPHIAGPDPSPQAPDDCGGGAKPPPRYAGAFATEPLPMSPSFNEPDVSDKPHAIQQLPSLDAGTIDDITRRYRCELGSLLAVDDGVRRLVHALAANGELRDTYLIFTSDNGFFHGEHRVVAGKQLPYEESIRVPLLMRGPGIPRGVVVRDLATNADLAPTIARIAGATPTVVMDGRPLLSAARHPRRETGRELPVEARTAIGVVGYRGIRTERYLYVEYVDGERELYDLRTDPFELRNRAADPAYARVRRGLSERLQNLRRCSGHRCRLRPRLGLAFTYTSATGVGGPCAEPPVRAQVTGHDVRNVVEARFYVDGRLVGVETRQPLRRRLPSQRLHRGGRTRVRLTASLLDGRRMTIDRSLRVCG